MLGPSIAHGDIKHADGREAVNPDKS